MSVAALENVDFRKIDSQDSAVRFVVAEGHCNERVSKRNGQMGWMIDGGSIAVA